MIPDPHQLDAGERAVKLLRKHMIAYLAMEERTGKTLSAILACEALDVERILVLTKKGKPLEGWLDTLAKFKHNKVYVVTNYHQAHKQAANYDLVVLDESHNYISSFPKRSKLWAIVRKLTAKKPILYISATPHAQGYQMLYNQFALSDWSPWRKYSSPYSWFRAFGIPDLIYLAGRQKETYNKVKPEVYEHVKHLFITMTRRAIGFKHEPEDVVHYISLSDRVKAVYNVLMQQKVLELNEYLLVCDTPMKLRTSLHQLEGGTIKITDKTTLQLDSVIEKIEYIKDIWGDTDQLAIMYHFKGELVKLQQHFKHAVLLQASTNAEGVDLSHVANLVIYSQDYSTAKHSQRRARQANRKRETPIKVHFLLVEKAISEQVYTTVSVNKTNFVDSMFQEDLL